jgi:hypothetical protein
MQTHLTASGVGRRTARTGQALAASQLQEKAKIPRKIAKKMRSKNPHVSIAR